MSSRFIFLAIALLAMLSPCRSGDKNGEYKPLSLHSINNMPVTARYQIGDPHATQKTWVEVHQKRDAPKRVKRATSGTLPKIDLTPADCNSKLCFPGWFGAPKQADCDVVEAAQLYNSTGSLTATPGQMVYVYAGTCAVVFQNPLDNKYTLQYNWASLGKVMQQLKGRCFESEDPSSGAACKINQYLQYDLQNVVISVQHFVSDTTCKK